MLCRYERTIFKSDKGFCIHSYTTEDKSVPNEARNRSFHHDDKIHFTAVGYHLPATNVVDVELDGTWEKSKYGLQLSVSMCKEIVPTDQAGILAYLSSGVIKGVGPEISKAIVARFGDKTMEVLDKEPQKLLSVRGIAKTKLKTIITSYEETKALSDLMIYLAPFGVSMKKAAMIKEEFGDDSLRVVKTDPFQLCKIKGFGFMTVDSIARKTKVSLKHPMRYSGAINYVLDEARVSGHLFLTVDETVGRCYDLLNADCEDEVVSEEEIREAITNECVESRIYVEGTRVYLSYERMCEVKAAKKIVSMLLQEDFEEIFDLDDKIDQAEKTLRQRLAPSQRNAVKLCLSYPISIMTGGPGSGKTTTLRFKFYNLTSVDKYYGTQSKCCPHYVGIQPGDEVVCVTEGIMKSDIAFCFAKGTPYACGFVGLTGVTSYSQLERALKELREFGVLRLNIMVDSDYQAKGEVRKARDRYIEMGSDAGFEIAPITWSQKRKGVDDLYKHLFRDK